MVAVRGCSIWDAACPVCKCTRASLEEAEQRLLRFEMAETAMDVDDDVTAGLLETWALCRLTRPVASGTPMLQVCSPRCGNLLPPPPAAG